MTSNLGAGYILDGITDNGEISVGAREEVEKLLKSTFKPEFLNRLDEIIFYKPLTRDNVYKILDILTENLKKRLAEQNINLEIDADAKKYIADNAFDPAFGARPLKRFLQSNVETLLAKYIVRNNPQPFTTLRVTEEYGDLVVKPV